MFKKEMFRIKQIHTKPSKAYLNSPNLTIYSGICLSLSESHPDRKSEIICTKVLYTGRISHRARLHGSEIPRSEKALFDL